MNPYGVLGVSPKASLQNLGDILQATQKLSDEEYQRLIDSVKEDEKYLEFIKSLESDEKIEIESATRKIQKELVLDKLIEAQYQRLYETATDFVKKELPSDASFEKIEQETKDRKALLKRAYETICTKEKREAYEQSSEYEKSQLFQQFEKVVPMMSKEEMIQKQIETILQKGIRTNRSLSIDELKRIESMNKNRMDSQNRYPNFSGQLFNWGIMMVYEHLVKDARLIDELNEKGERVFVTILGKLQYERFASGPTEESPQGIYGKEVLDGINLIGVTKSNANGEVLRNDIVVSKLKRMNSLEEKEFLKNVYFSDEVIDQANQENEGFMGNVIRKDRRFEIQYNDFDDGDVISVLRLASCEKGEFYSMRNRRIWQKEEYTLEKVKEKLAKFQLIYMKEFPAPTKAEPQGEIVQKPQEGKGEEDSWAK